MYKGSGKERSSNCPRELDDPGELFVLSHLCYPDQVISNSACSFGSPKPLNYISKVREEMAQRLRALTILPEDLGSIPSTHMADNSKI